MRERCQRMPLESVGNCMSWLHCLKCSYSFFVRKLAVIAKTAVTLTSGSVHQIINFFLSMRIPAIDRKTANILIYLSISTLLLLRHLTSALCCFPAACCSLRERYPVAVHRTSGSYPWNDVVPVLACRDYLNRCLSIDKIERYSLFFGSTVFVEYSHGRCTVWIKKFYY